MGEPKVEKGASHWELLLHTEREEEWQIEALSGDMWLFQQPHLTDGPCPKSPSNVSLNLPSA